MNRHQRRALAKVQGGSLGKATGQLQKAVQALQAVQELGDVPKQVAEAYVLMKETHAVVSAMADDYQVLADQLEALKILVLGIAGPDAEAKLEQILAQVRTERSPSTTDV